MIRNSTLLFYMDGYEGENELIKIDEMLDPSGKSSIELKKTFESIHFSPRNELIDKILMKI